MVTAVTNKPATVTTTAGTHQNPQISTSTPPSVLANSLQGDQRDAYLALTTLFNNYGLGTLANTIYNYITQGYSADTIQVMLEQTSEWKQRFAGNEQRRAAGLPVLSPSDYLSLESTYRQYMQSAGLPAGFYDQPGDFANWIGKDVSPAEAKARVDAAQMAVYSQPEYAQALKQMYGLSDGDLAAYWLDPGRALPLIQKQANAAAIGAQALSHGLAANTASAERLAQEGVTADQAKQGYAWISDTFNAVKAMADRYGGTWDQGVAEQAVFEPGQGSGGQTQRRLTQQEQGLFGGNAGSATSSGLRRYGGGGSF